MEQCKNPRCIKRIQQLEEELARVKSVGFDMLKQRGNWQATGTQPAHLAMEFDSIFTHEVEEMSGLLVKKSGLQENEARQYLSSVFQDVYKTCKEGILDRMRDTLSRILVLPREEENDEDLYDICRAYGLLLNVSTKSQSREQKVSCSEMQSSQLFKKYTESLEELKDFGEKLQQFSWKLLETVPPLVSETVMDTSFSKDWHEKELQPEWNEHLLDYSLVYYRPILFFSYGGKVAQKGWVGNTSVKLKQLDSTVGDEGHTSYKRPLLKAATMHGADEQAGGQTDPTAASFSQTSMSEDFEQLHLQPDLKNYPPDYSFGLKNLKF